MADEKLTVQIDGRDNLSGELRKIESGVIRFVGAVSSALTFLSGVAFPILEAGQFQKELLNAAKTTDFAAKELGVLKRGLRDLSTQIDVSALDLAKIATLGGQIGIGRDGEIGNPTALLEFTKTVATAVTALDLSAEEVVASFGKLVNIFNIKPSQFRNALSALNEVSNVSNATADQLFDVVRRIGNLGGSVSLPQAAALSASLIDLGLTAETAGTTITKIFADFKSNADAFAAVIRGTVVEATGDSIQTTGDFIRLVETDGLAALTAYVDALNRLPIEESSAIKGRLTGEGRLFEAVTKIQEQRKRQVLLSQRAADAENDYAEAVEAVARGERSQDSLKGLQARVEALREAAVQASVLARLSASAERAFALGDSAEKEQQTILGGLFAQFQVFLNNVKALTSNFGDVFVSPITRGLRDASKALQNPLNADSIRRAAIDIVDALAFVRDSFRALIDIVTGGAGGGTGLDWGAALRVVALLAAIAIFKGFIAVAKGMASSLLTAIGPARALAGALGGVQQAAAGAAGAAGAAAGSLGGTATAAQVAAQALQAQSTALRQMATIQQQIVAQQAAFRAAVVANDFRGIAAASAALAALRTQYQQAAAAAAAAAAAMNLPAAAAAASTNVFARLGARFEAFALGVVNASAGLRNARQALAQTFAIRTLPATVRQLQSVQSITDAITTQQRALRAAEAAGDRRRAAGLRTNIAFLEAVRARVVDLTNQINQYNAVLGAFGARVASLFTGVGTAAAAIFAPFVAAASAASIAVAGAVTRMRVALGTLSAVGPAAAVSGVLAGIGRAAQAAIVSIQNLGANIQNLGVRAAVVTPLVLQFSRLEAVIISAARAAVGLGVAVAASVGNLTLRVLGLSQAWQLAGTTAQRALVIMLAGSRAVAAAVRGVAAVGRAAGAVFRVLGGILGKAFSVVFIGLLIRDILKMTGLWEKFVGVVDAGFKKFNLETPSFFRGEADLRAQTAALAEIEQRYKATTEEASKLNGEMRSQILLAEELGDVRDALTFDAQNPAKASQAFFEIDDSLAAGFARRRQLQANELRYVRELASLEGELVRARSAAGDSQSGRRRVEELSKIIDFTREQQTANTQAIADLGNLERAQGNVLQVALNAREAEALFSVAAGESVSAIEKIAEANAKLITSRRELAALREDLPGRDQAGSLTPDRVALENAERQQSINALENSILAQDKAYKTLIATTAAAAGSTSNLDTIVTRFNSTLDPEIPKERARAMREFFQSGVEFEGRTAPVIDAGDLLTAGATFQVSNALADMYREWAANAEATATRAKNLAVQTIGEVARSARETTAFIDRLTAAGARAARQAVSQRTDRSDEIAQRKTLQDIQIRYDTERALLEEQLGRTERVLTEQEAGGLRVFQQKQEAYAFEQRALLALDEKYRKLREAEEDRLDIKKSRRNVVEELAQFDALIDRIREYAVEVSKANAVISDESASDTARNGAIVRRTDLLEKIASAYSEATGAAERIANVPPIGGQIVAKPAEIEKLKKSIFEVSEAIGAVKAQGASDIAAAQQGFANNLGLQAQEFATQAKAAFGVFRAQAEASGLSVTEAAVGFSKLLAITKDFSQFLGNAEALELSGLADPSSIDPSVIQRFAQESTQALQQSLDGKSVSYAIDIAIPTDAAAQAEKYAADFNTALQNSLAQRQRGSVAVEAALSGGSLDGMKAQVEGIKPVINGELNITRINGQGNLSVEVSGNRRGGLIGEVAALAKGIAGYARGGIPRAANLLRGPGNGTDDKMLSWLSNGEYVVDALTTARFGPGFFKSLQDAARGGKSLSFLKNFGMPQFAYGGFAGPEPIMSFAGIANDFNPGGETAKPKDLMEIVIASRGERATIQAERQQAKSLVSILRNFEKGR